VTPAHRRVPVRRPGEGGGDQAAGACAPRPRWRGSSAAASPGSCPGSAPSTRSKRGVVGSGGHAVRRGIAIAEPATPTSRPGQPVVLARPAAKAVDSSLEAGSSSGSSRSHIEVVAGTRSPLPARTTVGRRCRRRGRCTSAGSDSAIAAGRRASPSRAPSTRRAAVRAVLALDVAISRARWSLGGLAQVEGVDAEGTSESSPSPPVRGRACVMGVDEAASWRQVLRRAAVQTRRRSAPSPPPSGCGCRPRRARPAAPGVPNAR